MQNHFEWNGSGTIPFVPLRFLTSLQLKLDTCLYNPSRNPYYEE